jgi:hypothetical protein
LFLAIAVWASFNELVVTSLLVDLYDPKNKFEGSDVKAKLCVQERKTWFIVYVALFDSLAWELVL